MSKLAKLNPQKGEVVNIKFKSINQIMEENIGKKDFEDIGEVYEIQEHLQAYLKGGHFLVKDFNPNATDPYVNVINHLDHQWQFTVRESVIESIEEVDVAEKFVSESLRIIVVRIGHELYINGSPLIWNEDKRSKESSEYENENRKLIRMFESFIGDLAVHDAFKQEEG